MSAGVVDGGWMRYVDVLLYLDGAHRVQLSAGDAGRKGRSFVKRGCYRCD